MTDFGAFVELEGFPGKWGLCHFSQIRHVPPGGERMQDFIDRIHSAWEQLLEESTNKHRLLVCHGGVIRAILVHVLGMPNERLWHIDVPYANVSRVVIHHWGDSESAGQLRFHQARLM